MSARTAAYLVHIDPKSIDVRTVDAIEEVNKLLIPVLLRVWVKPVWEVTRSGPNNALIVATVIFLHKDIVAKTLVKRWVWFLVVYSRVNHDNIVLVSGVDSVHKIFDKISREPLRVEGEDSSAVHIVDCKQISIRQVN
jgi:hypothetical protein